MRNRSNLTLGTLFLMIGIGLLAFMLCGCTNVYLSDKATIIKSHILGVRITSAQGTQATPEVDVGNVFTELYIIPTSTNTLYIPRITDTSGSKSGWNPLAVTIEQSMGLGDVAVNVGSTNGAGGTAVIPKLPFPKSP